MKIDLAPLRGQNITSPWTGSCQKKPWEYRVTTAIPCLDTPETIKIIVELLRLQTEPPYILLIDTGSQPDQAALMRRFQADDCEVHFIHLNGVQHPSDFPAMAMDIAFTLCRTKYLFATHADCFLKKRTFIEDLIKLCPKTSPVVGYELSPRSHDDWHGMVSHTATIYHMPDMDKIGFGWSLRRLCNLYGIKDYQPTPLRPTWPDTEILGNYILRQHNIKPYLIGHEENFCRQNDDNIDHFRSYTSGKLYSKSYFAKVTQWFEDARQEALERIDCWREETIGKNNN